MKSIVKISINKQHGGTLLGLIIGLIVGLAIAVVVALMITKTSTPFTNKLGMSKNADAPPIQLTDPNKPLYSSSVREALANKPAESAANVTIDTTKSISKSEAESKTLETKIDSNVVKSTNSFTAKNEVREKAAYYLQVGAFRDASDAENVRAKLALLGIESSLSAKNSEGDNLFRVRIGPFDQLDAMNRMRSRLAENSIDVAVIKTPK